MILLRHKLVVTCACLVSVPLLIASANAATQPPAGAPKQTLQLPPIPTGTAHDFEYFMGSGWIASQRKLKKFNGVDSDWEHFTSYLCAVPYLEGRATVDELWFPTKGWGGLTLRTFNAKTHRWSVYWVSSRDVELDGNPVVGGFQGNRGVFYGTDVDDNNRPVVVRYIWTIVDHDHARWEQAFSYDDHTWKTNWIGDFQRVARDKVCKDNRPRHDLAGK